MANIYRIRNLLIDGVLILGVLMSGCTQQPAARPAAAPVQAPLARVAAETVRRADIQQTLSYGGDIRAREQISVLPKAAGRVDRVLVDVGSRVTAGDPLAVLEHDSAEIGVFQAQS